MSTQPDTDDPTPGMVECRVCKTEVPEGEYCGLCGIPLSEHRSDGPGWLRAKAYSASPGEHLFRPNIVSSLFPHLSPGSRMPFLVGLLVILAALVATSVFRLPAALITVAALGLPLLFLIYLQESDVYDDVPTGTLVATAGLGIGLGVGWVLLTGAVVAQAYDVGLGMGIAGSRILRDGLGVPIGGVVLMLVPALVVRFVRPGQREALDGFAIGALGALMFTAAAQMTRLSPQFAGGMIARSRPMNGLIVEAGIRGVAVPLTAAAVGGLIGTALWFTRPENKKHQHRNYVRLAVAVFALVVLVLYAGLGLVDVARMPQLLQLALHLGVTAVALLALRVGLHLALLHEAHDEILSDQPLLCPHCGHVVPDMAFCVACGAATRASSRSSRLARREIRPTRVEADPEPRADDA
ncbi:zinc ribbon domain-containing protein [Mycolicibacterium sp. P1-18]|uniref:zinc ribbon domain-containing protein n=1 Tax=Mycolicibacterium sp. P1-18 TaxID=2024615 RepID=UPI0011F3A7A9|nr:zinc ribbon domain-containing protein [Mycolicibacterium sp. P1-18]KAA0098559.1 zinc ribbon domain-containing protein [Mycolicibacterium sp. P1-18]